MVVCACFVKDVMLLFLSRFGDREGEGEGTAEWEEEEEGGAVVNDIVGDWPSATGPKGDNESVCGCSCSGCLV